MPEVPSTGSALEPWLPGSKPLRNSWAWRSKLALSFLFGLLALAFEFFATAWIPGADDGYRHVRYALRLATEGREAIADPWRLVYFWPTAMDGWFGYHLLLAPLTLVLPLIAALKTMVALEFAALAYVMLLVFEELGVAWKGAWVTLAIFGSGIVFYRGMYGRPFLLSMVLVMAALLFTLRGSRWGVFLASALHAFCYSIVFLVAAPVYLNVLLRRDWRSVKLALWCTAGMCFGMAANPYFPDNLSFYWSFIRGPLVAGRAQYLLTSGETEPLSIWWVLSSLPIAVLVLAGVARLVRRRGEVAHGGWLALITMSAFFVVSLRVSRTFDYVVPLGAAFAAAMLSDWFVARKKDAPYVAFLLALPCAFNLYSTWTRMVATPSPTVLEGVAGFLGKLPEPGLVFNAEWGEYHFLYFYNPRSRYVVGIDPSLMFLMNSRKYWLWRHISDDELSTCDTASCVGAGRDIANAIVNEFHPAHVLVEPKKNPRLLAYLATSPAFVEAYRDEHAVLFAARPQT